MKIFKLLKNTYKSTKLCIKYPFLYTRNRFTDKHYTNWTIRSKIQKIKKKYILNFSVLIKSETDYSTKVLNQDPKQHGKWTVSKSFERNGYHISIFKDGEYAELSAKHKGKIVKTYRVKIDDVLKPHKISYKDVEGLFFRTCETTNFMGERIYKDQILFVIKDDAATQDNYFNLHFFNFPIKSGVSFKTKSLEYIEKILSIFHVLPSHTELDALEKGWRNKFGEDICKEIRNSLLLTYIKNDNPKTVIEKIKCYYKGVKLLFSYRIEQIKEKYGSLRWYAYADTKDTHSIIRKYEDISAHTCIVCGKEATYRSTGWVCPYCDEHKPNGSIKIGEEYNDEY